MSNQHRQEALQQLKLVKIHMMPHLLEHTPQHIAAQFDSVWAPVERLVRQLCPLLPTALIQFLTRSPRGHLALTPEASSYETHAQQFHRRRAEAIAYISLKDLAEAPVEAFQVVGQLLDHLLGCRGEPRGCWLSDGYGFTPAWAGVGRQVLALYGLGYAVDQAAEADAHHYFARSVAWYIHSTRQLNMADPQIERLLKRTLFDERFCQQALPPGLA